MNEAFVESRKIMMKLEWTLPKEKDASCIRTTSYLLFIFFLVLWVVIYSYLVRLRRIHMLNIV